MQIGAYFVHVDGNLLEVAHAVAHPRQLDLLLWRKEKGGRGEKDELACLNRAAVDID